MNKQSYLWFGLVAVALAIAIAGSATGISAAPPNLPPRPTPIAVPTLAPGPADQVETRRRCLQGRGEAARCLVTVDADADDGNRV